MKIQSNINVDFPAVKRAFESCYGKIGITCADVGGVINNAGTAFDSSMTAACGGYNPPLASTRGSSASTVAVGSLLGASVLAAIAFLL